MPAVLTIGIPTYNRAPLLEAQLRRLAEAVRGHESQCEVIISDNCSTDDTPRVIERWRPHLAGAAFRTNRHPENIGAVPNIASLIQSATGGHAWIVSDDDALAQSALPYVMQTLAEHPTLALLILNFSSRWVKTGELRFARCYTVDEDVTVANGKELFERCSLEDYGGLALTTALVYRTDPDGLRNLDVQRYWTGFCALHGSVRLSSATHFECAAGTHFFASDPKLNFLLHYADKPEVTVRLMELGYSRQLCRRLVLKNLRRYGRFWVVLGMLVRWPGPTLDALARYAAAVRAVHPLEDGGWKLWRWLRAEPLPRG
jgi:abequosyltransferase